MVGRVRFKCAGVWSPEAGALIGNASRGYLAIWNWVFRGAFRGVRGVRREFGASEKHLENRQPPRPTTNRPFVYRPALIQRTVPRAPFSRCGLWLHSAADQRTRPLPSCPLSCVRGWQTLGTWRRCRRAAGGVNTVTHSEAVWTGALARRLDRARQRLGSPRLQRCRRRHRQSLFFAVASELEAISR